MSNDNNNEPKKEWSTVNAIGIFILLCVLGYIVLEYVLPAIDQILRGE